MTMAQEIKFVRNAIGMALKSICGDLKVIGRDAVYDEHSRQHINAVFL